MDYFLWEFSRGLYCSHGDHLIASKTFENFEGELRRIKYPLADVSIWVKDETDATLGTRITFLVPGNLNDLQSFSNKEASGSLFGISTLENSDVPKFKSIIGLAMLTLLWFISLCDAFFNV